MKFLHEGTRNEDALGFRKGTKETAETKGGFKKRKKKG